MKNLFLYIGIAVVLGSGLFTAYIQVNQKPLAINEGVKAGAFNPTGGGTYYLQASINSSQVTITLASFTEPSSGIPYTMSYLNSSIEYGTINPNSPTSEFISFTGITQNPNGTALLTGVTRGLGRSYPYTASTTLAHSVPGQTQFILSAPPQFYNQYYALANAATSSDVLTFSSTTPPRYDADPITANFTGKILADINYVNSVVAAGAANGSETVKGIYQLATAVQAAIGASIGSTGARLVLGANLATTTPLFTGTNVIPMTGTNQKLSQLFLDLTQAFTVSGLWQFGVGFISQSSSTVSANLDVKSLSVGGTQAKFAKFGGSGADGALALTAGTTTLDLGGQSLYVKNYTSISITGTGHLAFTNPNSGGTLIILKSQGNVTLTGGNPSIDASGLGASGGANCTGSPICSGTGGNGGNPYYFFNTSGGGGGTASQGTGGAIPSLSNAIPTQIATTTVLKYGNGLWVGAGGGGGGKSSTNAGTTGTGGAGGGGLVIEIGGALNFTSAILANGVSGTNNVSGDGGGGGGGAGGLIKILYNTLTAGNGLLRVNPGSGGAPGAGNGTGGGGGANAYFAGTNGLTGTGGTGAAGYSSIEFNDDF